MHACDEILLYIRLNCVQGLKKCLERIGNVRDDEINFLSRLTHHQELIEPLKSVRAKKIVPEKIQSQLHEFPKHILGLQLGEMKNKYTSNHIPETHKRQFHSEPQTSVKALVYLPKKIKQTEQFNRAHFHKKPLENYMSTTNGNNKSDDANEKIVQIFTDAFKNNLQDYDCQQAQAVARQIVQALVKHNKIGDKKFIGSKKLNISNSKNRDLCVSVYEGTISPEKFVLMSAEEMKSDELRKKEEQMLENNMCDIQAPKLQAETTMFKCGKCGQRKTTYYQMQTRSADEPMTNYVTCVICGNRWKFC